MEFEKPTFFKKCSNCKIPIGFKTTYQACSVSTCNHSRRGLYFCSVSCWSAHVPLLRHREAYALEKTSPSLEEYLRMLENEREGDAPMSSSEGPKKVLLSSTAPRAPGTQAPGAVSTGAPRSNVPKEVLVVVSKLKGYIKERADMNTSADVIDVLSERLRDLCDRAIETARADGRKTVMGRDF